MAVTALVIPISGPYTATWNAFSMGTMNDDGYVLRGTYQAQEINQSDAYGMVLVEAIYRGLNWRIQIKGLEWNKPGILASSQPGGGAGNNVNLTFAPALRGIGDRLSNAAQALVLTAILGNPPTIPQTLTALGAVVAPQSNVEYMMTSKLREAPFEFVLLPYVAAVGSLNFNVAFTTT